MKKGAKVRLSKNFKAIRAGCSGSVEFCHSTGELSVGLTNTPEGELFQWLLPPLPKDYFERLKDGEIKDA